MSDREGSRSGSRSNSRDGSRRRTYKSRSRSQSSESYSRSRSRGRKYSRSRSRSNSNRRRSRSRSRSYDRRRSSRNDRNDRYGYYRSRSKSPMSNRRRHQGDREHPGSSRCLGVFGLSLRTQERDLRDMFERYGQIEDLQIVYDHHTGCSRGFGFIYYKNIEDAMEAKEMAPGAEIDGKRIRVDYSITDRAHSPTPGVYLGRPTPGYRNSRRSRSPYKKRHSRSYSRSPSYSPRRYY